LKNLDCTFVVKITKTQKETLDKLRTRKIKIGKFVRDAISEKIKREASELTIKPKQICPF